MKTIGLTGGIGSGKTTVARLLEELGAVVFHADQVGHEVYRPDTDGWRQVTAAFGPDIVAEDRTIDRKKLGALVFDNPAALARLNAIVHPLIAHEVQRRIAAHRATGSTRPVVVEAAVLIEANWTRLVDEVWLVTATRDAIIDRVTATRGLSAPQVESRIDAQISDGERRRVANVVIENNGSLNELRSRVEAAWKTATSEAR